VQKEKGRLRSIKDPTATTRKPKDLVWSPWQTLKTGWIKQSTESPLKFWVQSAQKQIPWKEVGVRDATVIQLSQTPIGKYIKFTVKRGVWKKSNQDIPAADDKKTRLRR